MVFRLLIGEGAGVRPVWICGYLKGFMTGHE